MSIEIGTLFVVGGSLAVGTLAGAIGTIFGMPFGLGFLGGFLLIPVVLFVVGLVGSAIDELLYRSDSRRRSNRRRH